MSTVSSLRVRGRWRIVRSKLWIGSWGIARVGYSFSLFQPAMDIDSSDRRQGGGGLAEHGKVRQVEFCCAIKRAGSFVGEMNCR